MSPDSLRAELFRVKLTQAAVADQLNVDRSYLNQVLNGHKVSKRLCRRIERLLEEHKEASAIAA